MSRVKNDSTATSRSPIRRLRSSRPTRGFQRAGQPPPVPEASRQSDDFNHRHFDLSSYLDQPDDARRQRRSQPGSFLPPPLERDRPQSRNGLLYGADQSAPSRIVLLRPSQSSPHPLSFAHRPLSPDNGLGDRNRSPSPMTDAWQLIASTITPDQSLPSADSSFTSNNASTDYHTTDSSTQPTSQSDDSESPIVFSSNNTQSSSHPNDRRAIEALLYDLAMQTAEGRAQIQLIRRMSPEDTMWMRHHGSQSQEDQDNQDNQDEAPSRRPSQYDAEIREHTRQVAASTLRFFAASAAADTPPRSPSPSPRAARNTGDHSYHRTNSFLTRRIRDAAERQREPGPGDEVA